MVAENALDVAAEKGHWVILQVRALRPPWSHRRGWDRTSHCWGTTSMAPQHRAPPDPITALMGCWGPRCLCCEPSRANKVAPKAELPGTLLTS